MTKDNYGFISRAITVPNPKGGRSIDPWFIFACVIFTISTLNPVTGVGIPIILYCIMQAIQDWKAEQQTHTDKPDYSTKVLPKPRPTVTRNDR